MLDAHRPGARAVSADVESISLEFLTRYPTPAAARHPACKRMAAFLVKHGYSGRKPAAQLLDRLRQAPPGTTSEALTEALHDAVLALVTVLRALNGAVKDLDRPDRRPPRGAPGREDLHVGEELSPEDKGTLVHCLNFMRALDPLP